MRCALLLAVALLVAAPPAARAGTEVFVAYGTGVTACQITIGKSQEGPLDGPDQTEFYGRTDCTEPVQQTGRAMVPAGIGDPAALDGGLCSSFSTDCYSGGFQYDNGPYDEPMQYTISLVAPLGQGWIGAPTNCSGIGTDNLRCTFTVDDTVWISL